MPTYLKNVIFLTLILFLTGEAYSLALASPDAKSAKSGAVWLPPAIETLTYDAAGNRQGNAQWDYGWDAKNQLVRARTKNHTTAPHAYDLTYTYDAEGRRVQKHVLEYQNGAVISEKIITFHWDDWDLLYERHQLPSGLTLLERKYLWGPDIADGEAGGAGGLLLITEIKGNSTTNLIPLYDGTGHVIALTDIEKNLHASYIYGPFGEKITATGPKANTNPWRWATKYLDEETSLYYFGHRYYDPITGQWLSREPLGEEESLNLYSYCHNDPINKVDVLGLREYAIRNPDNPLVKINGEWYRNMIMIHEADWMWGKSRGILHGTEHVGRKAGPLDFVGLVQAGDKWVTAEENARFAQGIADLGWNLDSRAELTTLAPVAMIAPVVTAYTVATAAPVVVYGFRYAPVLYTSSYVKLTGASIAIQSSPWGIPLVGGALTSGAMILDGEDPGTAIVSGGMQAITGRATSAPINWNAMRPANWIPQPLYPRYAGRQGFLPGMVLNPLPIPAAPLPTQNSIVPYYPPNNGATSPPVKVFLMPGQTIDRVGGTDTSRFFSPVGTPEFARALPPGTAGQAMRKFLVMKPFEVESSTVAPWFYKSGGGTQYRTPITLEILLKRGILVEY